MKTKELRLGVIGVSGRGRLADQWNKPEWGCQVVAGADVNATYLTAFKDFYRKEHQRDVQTTLDYRELLARDDIDAIGIFSPDFCHEEHAIAALRAGKDIFCEKPLGITVASCDRILKAWKKSGRKFLMGFNMRYMNFIRTMKQIVDEGTIGDVKAVWVRHFVPSGGNWYFHDWHACRKTATSLLLQKACHDIDVVHWITGSYGKRVVGMGGQHFFGGNKPNTLTCDRCGLRETCTEVQARGNPRQLCCFRKEVDIEDVNHILWELESGVQCSYMQCHFAASNEKGRNYIFIGTEGMAENVYIDGHDCIEVTTRRSGGWKDHANRLYKVKNMPGTHSGADPVIAKEFIDILTKDATPTATPIDGRQSVAVGCAGAESLRNGSIPVNVPKLPKL